MYHLEAEHLLFAMVARTSIYIKGQAVNRLCHPFGSHVIIKINFLVSAWVPKTCQALLL